jgi:hypothetical protein
LLKNFEGWAGTQRSAAYAQTSYKKPQIYLTVLHDDYLLGVILFKEAIRTR